MKIRLTENQYKNLVEQINLKNLSREAQKLIKYWDQIDWNKVDSLALKKLTPETIYYAIKLFKKFRGGDGSSSPDITPLPTAQLYTDKEGSINSHYNKNRWGRKHHGVDLDTTGDVKNQPVVATCLGEVLRSEYGVAACGGMVLLGCYDGTQVQYCHLDFVIPKDTIVGQIVPQGFPLGVSGGDSPEYDKAGRSGGPHLHYALWNPYPDKSINPHIAYPNLFPSDKGSKQPPTMNR